MLFQFDLGAMLLQTVPMQQVPDFSWSIGLADCLAAPDWWITLVPLTVQWIKQETGCSQVQYPQKGQGLFFQPSKLL